MSTPIGDPAPSPDSDLPPITFDDIARLLGVPARAERDSRARWNPARQEKS